MSWYVGSNPTLSATYANALDSVRFLFGMSFIPVDTVQGYIWSSPCHPSGYLLIPGTVPI